MHKRHLLSSDALAGALGSIPFTASGIGMDMAERSAALGGRGGADADDDDDDDDDDEQEDDDEDGTVGTGLRSIIFRVKR